jgi:hypothetical protein
MLSIFLPVRMSRPVILTFSGAVFPRFGIVKRQNLTGALTNHHMTTFAQIARFGICNIHTDHLVFSPKIISVSTLPLTAVDYDQAVFNYVSADGVQKEIVVNKLIAFDTEGVLTSNLAAEVSRATGEESAIKTRLDNIEALLRHFFVDDAIL